MFLRCMKKVELEILSDRGGGRNIFEQFASEFERAALEKEQIPNLFALMEYFPLVERLLQDLGEDNDIPEEGGVSYGDARKMIIRNTKTLLSVWMALFESRANFPEVPVLLERELHSLVDYLNPIIFRTSHKPGSKNEVGKFVNMIPEDFDLRFLVSLSRVKAIKGNKEEEADLEIVSKIMRRQYRYSENELQQLYEMVLSNSDITSFSDREGPKSQRGPSQVVEDGEDVIYTWFAEVWIDSRDAGKANKFMHSFSSALLFIEGVEIEIIEAGVGSFFQKWLIRIRGWFAKEEVAQVMEKTFRAAEAFSLDRHIEPVEKIKLEKEKLSKDIEKMEEDRKRTMTETQIKEMHELELEGKREDIKAKKLANIKQHLEIQQLLSQRMAKGFVEVDSNYRIMINDLLAIKQTDKAIEIGDIGLIGEGGDKELGETRE